MYYDMIFSLNHNDLISNQKKYIKILKKVELARKGF